MFTKSQQVPVSSGSVAACNLKLNDFLSFHSRPLVQLEHRVDLLPVPGFVLGSLFATQELLVTSEVHLLNIDIYATSYITLTKSTQISSEMS